MTSEVVYLLDTRLRDAVTDLDGTGWWAYHAFEHAIDTGRDAVGTVTAAVRVLNDYLAKLCAAFACIGRSEDYEAPSGLRDIFDPREAVRWEVEHVGGAFDDENTPEEADE